MRKTERYRALRNIPVGWLLQALHSTDHAERHFRIFLEVLSFSGVYELIDMGFPQWEEPAVLVLAFFVNHTLMWFVTGNFWVYILDSFVWAKNPGVGGIIDFTLAARRMFVYTNSTDAILIYGSMCRCQFHGRSDLDLRVVRRRDDWRGWFALPTGLMLRAYSFFCAIPVDLQVVDSMDFVRRQMRRDERPIRVFIRHGMKVPEQGIDFDEVRRNPRVILRTGQ
jgi:hypothetical protein